MSTASLRILIVLEDGIDPVPIEEALPPGTRARVSHLSETGPAGPLAGDADSELLIVGSAGYSDRALATIEAAARLRPDRPVVVLYTGSPNGFMERAFEAGADDLITIPLPPADLAFALEKAIARRRGNAPKHGTGAMICVLGPKGGTGKTLTSCNLGVALALAGHRTVVVDLDLQFGDVGLALGMKPERTIYDLALAGGSLDADKVDGFLARHESGARALLAPLRPDQASVVDSGFLRSVFDILRSRYDFVIVDTPPAFTPEVIASIDSSSHLCVVGMLDVLSLKDTKIGLETLAQMGYEASDVTLVLNRADTNVGIKQGDVELLLGRRPDVLVPSDRAVPRALTEGRTIVAADPKCGPAKAFRALAERYVRAHATAKPGAPAQSGRHGQPPLKKVGR
ncbi:MAG TPA: AAA family ATPase [Gaiellaceae bacterium]|nr:AAA family ATPase [Gaiellaceae bacterium]